MRRKGVDIEEEKWAYNFSYVRAKGGDSSCKARWFATEPLFPVVTPSSPRIWIRATIPLRHDQKFGLATNSGSKYDWQRFGPRPNL